MVLKTCKWFQTVRLVMTRRLVPSMTFLRQIFKLTHLGHYVQCFFAMTSGDLNIDLTPPPTAAKVKQLVHFLDTGRLKKNTAFVLHIAQ